MPTPSIDVVCNIVKISNKFILLPTIVIVFFSTIGLLVIDAKIKQSLGSRVNTELERIAKIAHTTLSLSDQPLTTDHVDAIANKIGKSAGVRITFINHKGEVTGDSDYSIERLLVLDNHDMRPEVIQARKSGVGFAKRYSDTQKLDTIYVAFFQYFNNSTQANAPYIARASLTANTIETQLLKVRVALLTLLITGVFILAFLTSITLHWLAKLNEREKIQLAMTLNQRDIELESMHELDALLSTCSALSDANSIVEQLVPNLLPGTSGYISLYKSSRDRLTSQMFWGSSKVETLHFLPNQCWALRKGHQHLAVSDKNRVLCEHYDNVNDASTLCIPLVSHGETIGVMHVIMPLLEDKTIALAGAIAKRMSMAIANIELKYSLTQQAIRDTLTNLYNRRYLFETLEQLIARAHRNNSEIGIIMLDLDHFKQLNDTYGHDIGDVVLKHTANFFQKHTRESDLVCRYGGEEFCLVCPDSNEQETLLVANKLCTGVASHSINVSVSTNIIVTLSGGIAVYPNKERSIDITIKQADQALYKAKAEGRNCIRLFDKNDQSNNKF